MSVLIYRQSFERTGGGFSLQIAMTGLDRAPFTPNLASAHKAVHAEHRIRHTAYLEWHLVRRLRPSGYDIDSRVHTTNRLEPLVCSRYPHCAFGAAVVTPGLSAMACSSETYVFFRACHL